MVARPSRHEADEGADGPERRCIVTRRSGAADGLIRFVLAPDGTVVPDLARRLPGRGAWVTAQAWAVAEAARRSVFSRALKTEARPPADLAGLVGRLLRARALQGLSLARKAGAVVTGMAKVDATLRAGRVAALVHASEAGEDGVRRLAALARGLDMAPCTLRVFAGEELDLALGRANVIHAALTAGDATRMAIERACALERYGQSRSGSETDEGPGFSPAATEKSGSRDREDGKLDD